MQDFQKYAKVLKKGKCLQYKQKYTKKPMFAASNNNEKYEKIDTLCNHMKIYEKGKKGTQK